MVRWGELESEEEESEEEEEEEEEEVRYQTPRVVKGAVWVCQAFKGEEEEEVRWRHLAAWFRVRFRVCEDGEKAESLADGYASVASNFQPPPM